MQFGTDIFVKGGVLLAILVLVAACADEPQKKSQIDSPVVAAATQTAAPAIAVPLPVDVPVPAYGPNPHPNYYYPPTGFAVPGPAMH